MATTYEKDMECPSKIHGKEMLRRDMKNTTPEQKWCGIWYDCQHTGCHCSILEPSAELKAMYDAKMSKDKVANSASHN